MKICGCGEPIAENEQRCGTCLNESTWENPNPAPASWEYPGVHKGIKRGSGVTTWDMPTPLQNNRWDVPAKDA